MAARYIFLMYPPQLKAIDFALYFFALTKGGEGKRRIQDFGGET
jgi:hypothetical protein